MMSIFAVLLVAALNLIPADVSTFTMEMNENETIRFTKQADGGWSGIELPKDDVGTFYVTGTKLTMKGKGKSHTQDLAKMLGVDDKTDWSQLKSFTLGRTPVQIDRKKDGIDFTISQKREGKTSTKAFKVRWEPNPFDFAGCRQCVIHPAVDRVAERESNRQWAACGKVILPIKTECGVSDESNHSRVFHLHLRGSRIRPGRHECSGGKA